MKELRLTITLAALVLVFAPALTANTRKGDKFLKDGAKAEGQKDYDKAIELYGQALSADPNDPGYQLAERRARFKSAEIHVSDGIKLRNNQKIDEALAEFQKAYVTDPSYTVAVQEIRNTEQMLREKAKLPAGTPVLSPAQKAQRAVDDRVKALEAPPELRPLNNQITNLRMNNQSMRVLYETVSKLAGINVLFDSTGGESLGGGQKNFNLDLNRVTLSEALDYIALLTHTFWKPISTNAIFVATDSAQKRQEYQDQVVKVFYIQNVGAQAEFQDFFNAVRTGANLTRGLIQLPSQNALIARGTSDQIAVVEKIIHDLDKPKAEVLIDVIVLEVSKNYQRTLSAALAGATNGLNVPILFTPRNPTLFGTSTGTTTGATTGITTGTTTGATNGTTTGQTTGTTTGITTGTTNGTTTGTTNGTTTGSTTGAANQFISLSQIGHISTNDFSINLPGALLQALLQNNTTRVLQRPQLRATDGGKASLKIGSKIPYVSGSLNSAVATPGSIPYATTQFQQVDVGTNLDLQPRVNGPDDISMHIKVEISQVSSTTNIGGVDQPIISQRINEAEIRLRNGEVSMLGGLTQNSDSLTTSGIPGLVNMPVLGYLFGGRSKNKVQDEILIALIPHIIRAPDLSAVGEDPIQTGTETNFRVLRSIPNSATIVITPGQVSGSQTGSPQPSAPPAPISVPQGQPALPPRQPTALPPPSPRVVQPGGALPPDSVPVPHQPGAGTNP